MTNYRQLSYTVVKEERGGRWKGEEHRGERRKGGRGEGGKKGRGNGKE